MKKKILSIFSLCLISLMCLISLAGCGSSVSAEEILTAYTAMTAKLEENSAILSKVGNRNTAEYYQISYGDVVDRYVSAGYDDYVDLQNYYNSVFSFAMSYMDENYTVITNLIEDDTNSATIDSLPSLKSAIEDFTEEIDNFVDARNTLDIYFKRYGNSAVGNTQTEKLVRLREFKRSYVEFVNKSVEMSLALSDSVEATGILNSVLEVGLNRNYVCNKILRVYNELYIQEVGTFNFGETEDSLTKDRLQDVLDNLYSSMSDYSSLMSLTNLKQSLSETEIAKLKEMKDIFMTELEVYIEALDILDVRSLCVDYDNDMERYLQTNSRAEICLERVEQFVSTSLPDFLTYVRTTVAN